MLISGTAAGPGNKAKQRSHTPAPTPWWVGPPWLRRLTCRGIPQVAGRHEVHAGPHARPWDEGQGGRRSVVRESAFRGGAVVATSLTDAGCG